MKTLLLPVVLLVLSSAQLLAAADPAVRQVKVDDETVASVVPTTVPLLHTSQNRFAEESADITIESLTKLLRRLDVEIEQVVKVNVVAATPERAEKAARAFATAGAPVSIMVGALPGDAAIGVDLVATGQARGRSGGIGLLPPGPRVFVSGQAERAATPAEAAAQTLASLVKTLEFVGATKDQVVQAKCFLTPMSAHLQVEAEFEKVFGKVKLPLVFVEWKSDLPIEIELIAAAPPAKPDAPAVEYLTPPGMNASPVFARVVRVNRGDMIYTAGLYADKPGSGEQQVLSIFEQLQQILKQTGGDMRHLAKATYYVSDADASKQLNVLRPKFYDPQRPPAASKAMVPGVGMEDRSIEIDMIGVVSGD